MNELWIKRGTLQTLLKYYKQVGWLVEGQERAFSPVSGAIGTRTIISSQRVVFTSNGEKSVLVQPVS